MPGRHAGLLPVIAEDRPQPGGGERLPAFGALRDNEQFGGGGLRAFREQIGLDERRDVGIERDPRPRSRLRLREPRRLPRALDFCRSVRARPRLSQLQVPRSLISASVGVPSGTPSASTQSLLDVHAPTA